MTRWIQAANAHGCDPLDVFTLLGKRDFPVVTACDPTQPAQHITPQVLDDTCQLWNIRLDWLCGKVNQIYQTMPLDRALSSLVDDLSRWKRQGAGHALLVFRSGKTELEEDIHQHGALVLRREVAQLGERTVYAYQPISTLQWWTNAKQRWLALRAIWTAWEMSFDICGFRATEKQCSRISEGTLFPGLVRATEYRTWHPDDYVVRPSPYAKGAGWIDAIVTEYDQELSRLLSAAQITRRGSV